MSSTDRTARIRDDVEMTRCMGAAKHHFPGIGGETTVLRLAWE